MSTTKKNKKMSGKVSPASKKPRNEKFAQKPTESKRRLPDDWLPSKRLKLIPTEFGRELIEQLDFLESTIANELDEERRKNALVVLRNTAVYAAYLLQGLYQRDQNGSREMVQEVALKYDSFAQVYDFCSPMPFRKEVGRNESSADQVRRELTKLWQSRNFRFSNKMGVDLLTLLIHGFHQAVRLGIKDRMKFAGAGDPAELVFAGYYEVPEDVREELLGPDGQRDITKWTRAFVDQYDGLISPWPYKKDNGEWDWPTKEQVAQSPFKDPIHELVYQRFLSRQSANPDDSSVLSAFLALISERIENYFS